MSPIGRVAASLATALVCLASVAGCKRTPQDEQSRAQARASVQTPTPASRAAPAVLERLDPRAIPVRGVPTGTEGRFNARPAIVASPCGFHLVVSGQDETWTALLVGHELSWSKEGSPVLLGLDGLTLDVGLVDAKTMGSVGPLTAEPLLALAGQWESTWLSREAVAKSVPINENASGRAHLEPHPVWRVWSATLGPGRASADVPTSHVVIGTVALSDRVLVLRALLDDEKLALRALRRLVFAVDSIETKPGSLGRRAFVETLQRATQEDPTCAGIHDAHDAQLR